MNKKMLGFVAVAAFLAVEMSAGTANAQGMLKRMRARFGRTQQTQCCPATCQTAATGMSESMVVAPVSYNEPISYGESMTSADATYSEPVFQSGPVMESPILEGPVMESAPACGCNGQASYSGSIEPAPLQQIVDTGSFEAVPAVGCQDCGSIQQASYVEPIAEGEYFGGDSGCIGCESPVQGCASGDCGSVVSGSVVSGSVISDGGIVEGQVIEGEVISGSIDSGVTEGGFIDGGTIQDGFIESEIAPTESASDVPEPPTQAPAVEDNDQDA